ncbi:MAG: hypothetical protein JST59_25815 [Actinobacteria bacterium]|nr:hypothetical protein [Actinomycetota bacterium]
MQNLVRGVGLLALLALLLVGCGGGGSGTSASATNASDKVAEPSKEFQDPEGPKGPEPVATFGKESGSAEREEASAVLADNLTAREKADFAKQCETLGKRGIEAILGKGKANERSKCEKELKTLAEPLAGTKEIRADTLSGEIAALRIKGKQAYALYHGNDGNDYAMPMEEEGGSWKVGGIITTELPQEKPKPKSAAPEKKKEG